MYITTFIFSQMTSLGTTLFLQLHISVSLYSIGTSVIHVGRGSCYCQFYCSTLYKGMLPFKFNINYTLQRPYYRKCLHLGRCCCYSLSSVSCKLSCHVCSYSLASMTCFKYWNVRTVKFFTRVFQLLVVPLYLCYRYILLLLF